MGGSPEKSMEGEKIENPQLAAGGTVSDQICVCKVPYKKNGERGASSVGSQANFEASTVAS